MYSIRVLISCGVNLGGEIEHLNHNASFHGDLEEELYMDFPRALFLKIQKEP